MRGRRGDLSQDMKVLHVIPSYIPAYRYGGPVKGVHELCKALVRRGIDLRVFTTDADIEKRLNVPLNTEQEVDGVRVIYHPVEFFKSYYYSSGLAARIKSEVSKFDIVHIHSVFLYPTYITAYWCRVKGIPYIINPFGALDPEMIKLKSAIIKTLYIRIIEKKNIEKAATLHVASEYEKGQFLSLGLESSVTVIPRGIDLDDYKPPHPAKDFRQRHPQLKGKEIILSLGRIHFKKGFDMLAAAFKEIVAKREKTQLVIAGPDERGYAEKVKALFGKLKLQDNVLFTGMLLGEDKLAAFYASDLFVLPSYGENFGITVLEAMACGIPVVITKKVGLSPDIERYKAGMVVDCVKGQISDAILTLLEKKDLRRSMGDNGRRLVEEKFTRDKIADETIKLYDSILKKRVV
ncbi:MAG: glycosyltransferase [Candidatus Omnitrophota bacterium]